MRPKIPERGVARYVFQTLQSLHPSIVKGYTNKDLAKLTGFTGRGVRKIIAELKRDGFIEVERGEDRTNIYYIKD